MTICRIVLSHGLPLLAALHAHLRCAAERAHGQLALASLLSLPSLPQQLSFPPLLGAMHTVVDGQDRELGPIAGPVGEALSLRQLPAYFHEKHKKIGKTNSLALGPCDRVLTKTKRRPLFVRQFSRPPL